MNRSRGNYISLIAALRVDDCNEEAVMQSRYSLHLFKSQSPRVTSTCRRCLK